MEGPGAYRAETTNSTENKRKHKKNKVCVVVALPALPQIVALPAEEALIYLCVFYLQFLIIKQLSALPLEKDSSGFLS